LTSLDIFAVERRSARIGFNQTSFATLNGFLWAIPVSRVIGTVLGLAWGDPGISSTLLDNIRRQRSSVRFKEGDRG